MTTTETPLHIRQAEGLRALADLIEQNPEIAENMRQPLSDMGGYAFTVEPIATFVRAAAKHGAKIVKDYPDNPERHFSAYAHFGPVTVRLHTDRQQVCEQVGTKTVTKTVKDPEALKAVPEVEVTEEVPVWECKPLLASTSDGSA